MIRIKSISPSRLIITDAGIKLKPGEETSVENLSPQTQRLIEDGHLVRVDTKEKLVPVPAEKSVQVGTIPQDDLLHSYKTSDTLHLDGRISKAGILVKLNNRELWVTGQAFDLLLKFAVRLKNDYEGWVCGSNLSEGNYHVCIMRLKKQIAPYLKDPASEFIENNGHGAYRISTHPRNISIDVAKIRTLHSDPTVHKLLESAGKSPSNS